MWCDSIQRWGKALRASGYLWEWFCVVRWLAVSVISDGVIQGLGLYMHLLPLSALRLTLLYLILWQRYSNCYHCVNSASGCFQDSESCFLYSAWDRNIRSSPASHDLNCQWPWPKCSPLFKELFFKSFFLLVWLTNKDCLSGDLKPWTVHMADAIGEGCLGRSVSSPEAGPIMSPECLKAL